jgi:hypothetical protein
VEIFPKRSQPFEGDLVHYFPSERHRLLFGLSLILRKQSPLADNFSARFVLQLHIKNPLLLMPLSSVLTLRRLVSISFEIAWPTRA